MTELTISAGGASCPVIIGTGLTERLAAELSTRFPGFRRLLLCDSSLLPLWGARLSQQLGAKLLSFPAGEASKTREVKAQLEDRMLERGFGRDTVLICLGGGVCLDLGGFLAATYQRGIPCVYVPTTALALVDAAIGGKCAVNTPAGKNMIGLFRMPELVAADLRYLTTLPEREYRAGLAEGLKLGFVLDRELLAFFEANTGRILAKEPEPLEEFVRMSVRTKARVVEEDFLDRGLRRALNYGHSYGHAVETALGYTALHGECVAEGMRYAARKARDLGLCTPEWSDFQEALLDRLGLVRPDLTQAVPELFAAALGHDKKNEGGRAVWVLSPGPGQCVFHEE